MKVLRIILKNLRWNVRQSQVQHYKKSFKILIIMTFIKDGKKKETNLLFSMERLY